MAERVMRRFYSSSRGDPSNLPWHREEPANLLIDTVQSLSAGARVFDVGRGAGVFAVWMSSQGKQVTAIDLFPEAISMAQQRASQNGVDVTWVCGDLFEYIPDAL
jgi:2-polyprenyl-3-methyl-5-hydroxy-6-metoxy-1,4-benzoquinol methylase